MSPPARAGWALPSAYRCAPGGSARPRRDPWELPMFCSSFVEQRHPAGLTGVGLGFVLLVCLSLPACSGTSPYYLQQSQLRTQQMYLQNRNLATQNQNLGQIAAQNQQLQQQNMALKAQADLANQRLHNLNAANEQLEGKFRNQF